MGSAAQPAVQRGERVPQHRSTGTLALYERSGIRYGSRALPGGGLDQGKLVDARGRSQRKLSSTGHSRTLNGTLVNARPPCRTGSVGGGSTQGRIRKTGMRYGKPLAVCPAGASLTGCHNPDCRVAEGARKPDVPVCVVRNPGLGASQIIWRHPGYPASVRIPPPSAHQSLLTHSWDR